MIAGPSPRPSPGSGAPTESCPAGPWAIQRGAAASPASPPPTPQPSNTRAAPPRPALLDATQRQSQKYPAVGTREAERGARRSALAEMVLNLSGWGTRPFSQATNRGPHQFSKSVSALDGAKPTPAWSGEEFFVVPRDPQKGALKITSAMTWAGGLASLDASAAGRAAPGLIRRPTAPGGPVSPRAAQARPVGQQVADSGARWGLPPPLHQQAASRPQAAYRPASSARQCAAAVNATRRPRGATGSARASLCTGQLATARLP